MSRGERNDGGVVKDEVSVVELATFGVGASGGNDVSGVFVGACLGGVVVGYVETMAPTIVGVVVSTDETMGRHLGLGSGGAIVVWCELGCRIELRLGVSELILEVLDLGSEG